MPIPMCDRARGYYLQWLLICLARGRCGGPRACSLFGLVYIRLYRNKIQSLPILLHRFRHLLRHLVFAFIEFLNDVAVIIIITILAELVIRLDARHCDLEGNDSFDFLFLQNPAAETQDDRTTLLHSETPTARAKRTPHHNP